MITEVTKIPQEGINFYRDKKMSANAISEFVKDDAERKKLIKVNTYYEMESIKKLWRYILKILIEYITLDSRFDRIRTHHFVLLNHFRHGFKISFPFYLYTSLSKGIEDFKRKPITNPALHEGLLLLVYEFFKTQTKGKSLGDPGNALEDTTSSNFGDVQVIKIGDEEKSTKATSISFNPLFPSRKSPRCLPPIPPKPEPQEEKEDSKEVEETKTYSEDEDKVKGKDIVKDEEKGRERDKEEDTLDVSLGNPRKEKLTRPCFRKTPLP